MKKESVCFVNLDNVLGDFDLQVRIMTGHNIKGLENKLYWSNDERTAMFMTDHLKDFSEQFWRNMPLKQDAHKLLDDCLKRYDSIKLISRYEPPIGIPHRFLYVREAKIRWAIQHFHDYVDVDNVIVTKHNKSNHMELDKINVLIDSSYDEIRKWRSSGGIGVLYTEYEQYKRLLNYQKYRGNERE